MYIFLSKIIKIEGISGGIYYYNPIANTIYKIYNSPLESSVHYYSNQKNLGTFKFYLFLLVYNSEANIRKYGSDGYKYALIDSGYLGQHVTTVAKYQWNFILCYWDSR